MDMYDYQLHQISSRLSAGNAAIDEGKRVYLQPDNFKIALGTFVVLPNNTQVLLDRLTITRFIIDPIQERDAGGKKRWGGWNDR
jgi:hypothetical protein